MKPVSVPRTRLKRRISLVALTMLLTLGLSFTLQAQAPQLSLADILIALRSKKVSLIERNQILTEAVKARGVTFELRSEIEKELAATGASPDLIAAIRAKSPKPAATPAPTPIPTPTPPDFSFYQKRADASVGKGEFAQALVDYDKALEMKADDSSIYVSRGKTHYSLKSYDRSVADYNKSIELDPKAAVAYFNRGASYEKLGQNDKAMADYQKAVELDSTNEFAKGHLKRLQDEAAKALAAKQPPPKPVEPVKPPEFINLGNLSNANAVRMVTPVYSPIAQRSSIEGRVTVDVQLDEKGEVVSAKATSGHAMLRSSAEDAARKSKFKPAMFNSLPIKAIGVITYNFSLRGGQED